MRVPAPCYFMVVDILGFSEIIKNLDGDEQNQRVVSWLDLVETTRHQVGVKDTQLISDTLFVREEDSIEGLAQLLRFAQLLLERGLERNFPLRGAIVHGDAAWGRLTYGKAVIEAHQMERSLDWIGVACERNLPLEGLPPYSSRNDTNADTAFTSSKDTRSGRRCGQSCQRRAGVNTGFDGTASTFAVPKFIIA